jgi:hypothetical protein
MKTYILSLISILICSSCHLPSKSPASQRAMFDASGLHVITSFANRKHQLMYILYGNNAALQEALRGNIRHIPGEIFTLVTWKQANNKYWYGSYINGALQSVEILSVTIMLVDNDERYSDNARISLILSQQPSVFP